MDRRPVPARAGNTPRRPQPCGAAFRGGQGSIAHCGGSGQFFHGRQESRQVGNNSPFPHQFLFYQQTRLVDQEGRAQGHAFQTGCFGLEYIVSLDYVLAEVAEQGEGVAFLLGPFGQ